MEFRKLTKPEAEALALARGILYEFAQETPEYAAAEEGARPFELVYHGMKHGRIIETAGAAEDAVFAFLNVLGSHAHDPIADEFAHTRITLPPAGAEPDNEAFTDAIAEAQSYGLDVEPDRCDVDLLSADLAALRTLNPELRAATVAKMNAGEPLTRTLIRANDEWSVRSDA